MTEELLVCDRGVVELLMVVLGTIKVLTVSWIELVIVLGKLYVEVRDPAELTVDVSFLRKLCVVRHSGSFDLIFLVRVQLALRMDENTVLVLEVFVEVLL